MEMAKAPVRKIRRRTVEYSLTEHCNLSCYNCDHASPLLDTKFASLEEFSRDVRALAKVMDLQVLTLIGGEPLLHPQILDFIRIGRESGIAEKIVIRTNGVLLHTMPDEFWQLIDILRISLYPGVKQRLSKEDLKAKCERFSVDCDVYERIAQFDRTVINTAIKDPTLVRGIFRECKMAHEWECLSLHDGMLFRCSVAPFMDKRLKRLGIDFDSNATDGVRVADNPRLYEEVEAALTTRDPLKACTYCLGKSGPVLEHRQLNREGRAAWEKEDHSQDIELARRIVRRQAINRFAGQGRQAVKRAVRKVLGMWAPLQR
jgi:organic radical activating enzyme